MADLPLSTSALNTSALDTLKNRYEGINASKTSKVSDNNFSSILSSAMNMISETNSLSNQAEEAEINFALGNADSIHEVTVAQQKAYVSLQYTVAVKNALLSAYNEIMNIQI